jgi:methionine sulfoxide reductase heme-binding subunit
MILRKDVIFFIVTVLLSLIISLTAFWVRFVDPFEFSIRLFGLLGFVALSIATIMTPFLKEITIFFKRPFIKIHHYFAAAGLIMITLHPVILAIQMLNPAVFIPNVDSIYLFLYFGGRQALIIIYVALVAVFVRRRLSSYWRPFHALMYLALFFGIVHANLLGTDFLQNIFIMITFNALFVASIAVFILKRWQLYKIGKRRKKQ